MFIGKPTLESHGKPLNSRATLSVVPNVGGKCITFGGETGQ